MSDSLKTAQHPQEEYIKAGSPMGGLEHLGGMLCWRCQQQLRAYSEAGVREWSISGFCEPCFDVVTTPEGEHPWRDSPPASTPK